MIFIIKNEKRRYDFIIIVLLTILCEQIVLIRHTDGHIFALFNKNITMSRKEHFNILIVNLFLTVMLALTQIIHGMQIVLFAILSLAGLYFTFYFVKYVYAQKNYTD